ncbi:MAG: hypothetical protein II440_07150 [Clostridia bacterium]|nr:hypothetical protein [Clostridia bacterium]
MKRIDENYINIKEWFTVKSDSHMCTCSVVGTDTEGNFIYESSVMDNMGPSYFMRSVYYSITLAELEQYAKQALDNGKITNEQYKNILKEAEEISQKDL